MDMLTVSSILKQYAEVTELFGNSKTVADARRLKDSGKFFDVEVEGFDAYEVYEFDLEYVPDWIRLENYKNLEYIYFFKDGSVVFDIGIDYDVTLAENIKIEDVTKKNFDEWYGNLNDGEVDNEE